MLITKAVLENFNACEELRDKFVADHPHGLDISPLWGSDDEAQMFWAVVLGASEWKRQVGWAIGEGLLPARIRANLYRADLTGANLVGADLTGANLTGVRYNQYTRWPVGFDATRL